MNYWTSFTTKRIARRRALAAAGGAVAGAALLSACGGGESGSSDEASSLVYKPVDTTSKSVKGGMYSAQSGSIAAFDTLGNGTDSTHALHGYSRLVRYKVFKYPEKATPSVEPDGVSSWEVSPDGTKYTFKVRANQKFDPRNPTNGRVMNSADIKFSWERYEKLNPFRTFLANKADKSAPVTSVSTPDANTVVMDLAFPYAPLLPVFAYNRSMAIIPVEADGKFDVKSEMRGSGPWRLKEFLPSARVVYEPNPDWYDASTMNFTGLTYYNIPEYAAELAQFKTGNLATISEMPQSDVLPTKRDLPSILMKQVDNFELAHDFFRFSYLPDSPFRDDRVRKAVSMLIDRDLSIATMNETQQFKDAGFQVETRWNSAIICGETWWMDPRSSEFGPEAKWFNYDPAEAKKLLSAAGHKAAIKAPFVIRNEQSAIYEREAQIMHGMLTAHGDFDMEFQVRDYRSDYRANVHYGSNTHQGIAFGFFSSTMPDVDLPLVRWYLSGQETGGHLDASGKVDAQLDSLIMRQRAETDVNKRAETLKEFQRYAAKTMYAIMGAGDSTRFELGQPWLGNWGVFRTSAGAYGAPATEIFPHLYIDASKRSS